MKKTKNIFSLALCVIMASACFGCGDVIIKYAKPSGVPSDYVRDDYVTAHSSRNNYVKFVSSDSELDGFLNDYTERHMRDGDKAIGDGAMGKNTRAPWREWDSMAGSFWDASSVNGTMSKGNAVNDNVNDWLADPIQDKTGYVWNGFKGVHNTNTFDDWGMGWAFPEVSGNGGKYWTFDENSSSSSPGNVNTGKPVKGTEKDWKVADAANYSVSVTNGAYHVSSNRQVNKIEIYTENFGVLTRETPFLRMGFSFAGSGGFDIEDLYVSFKTNDGGSDWLGRVGFSDFCVNGFEIGKKNVGLGNFMFPMFLLDDWGAFYDGSEHVDRRITGLKIELCAKPGTTFSGTLAFDYICSEFDDRQILNCCNYIIAAKNNLEFSWDKELLRKVLPNARKAMNFLLDQGMGNSGLVSVENLAGHFNDGTRQACTAIGNGYWDVDAFPNVNIYCNLSYLTALDDMIYLEQMAELLDIPERAQTARTTTVRDNRVEFVDYVPATAKGLTDLAERCRERMRTEFWNEETGRFHAGRRDNAKRDIQDRGYTLFNEQAIILGVATPEQTKSILEWINGERIIETDDAQGDDIYHYEIAPRFNTQSITDMYRDREGDVYSDFAWVYWAGWNGNVQNGGTGLHLSYYDVVAQTMYDTVTGFNKLYDLCDWYSGVQEAGGVGRDFYRKYYREREKELLAQGIREESVHLDGHKIYPNLLQGGKDEQGHDQNGMIGVDVEFYEAAILIRSVPDAFFGLSTRADKTLCFTPRLPEGLDWWRMENLVYDGLYYDVAIGKYMCEISNVHNYSNNVPGSGQAKVGVTFDIPLWNYEIAVDGKPTSAYTINADNTVTVTVPMQDARIEIREKK